MSGKEQGLCHKEIYFSTIAACRKASRYDVGSKFIFVTTNTNMYTISTKYVKKAAFSDAYQENVNKAPMVTVVLQGGGLDCIGLGESKSTLWC